MMLITLVMGASMVTVCSLAMDCRRAGLWGPPKGGGSGVGSDGGWKSGGRRKEGFEGLC